MAHFVIEGKNYEVPETDSLTMGDAETVYDYTSLGLDEIDAGVRHPGLASAYLHIAYERGNPDVPYADVKKLVRGTRIVEAFSAMDGEDDAGPPDQTNKPSNGSSARKRKSSGGDLPTSSDEPDDAPTPTTTSE